MDTSDIDILLVEDNAADLELTLHALHMEKFANRVHVARDGEEALDFLFCQGSYSSRSPERVPRLVVLDLKLPKIDGMQVLAQMKSNPRTRAIAVTVLTSSKEDRDLTESYRLGANSYIQKPVGFDQFRETVRCLGQYWLTVNQPAPSKTFTPESVATAGERGNGRQ